MEAKKIVYMVIMRAYDGDEGGDCETVLFEKREDAQSYWKKQVNTEMFCKDVSWVADEYNNGNYNPETCRLVLTEDFFSFRRYDREMVWSIEEKEVR